MAGLTGYDYGTDPLSEQATDPVHKQAGGSELTGYDYGADPMGDDVQPGAQLSDTRLKMPEYEETDTEELSFMEELEEMWTGERRRTKDWAEVPVNVQTPAGEVVPIQDQMSIARDNDLARAEIFQTQLPEADVEFDENLNPYTTYFGEPRYLNRPGRSMGDISEALTTLPAEFLAARSGASIGRGLGLTGQIVGAGGALFGTSLAQDKFAEVWGSKQPADWKRAQMMGMFGAGGEAVGMMLGKFFNQFFSSRRFVKKDGEFTRKGRTVLEAQGIDPETVTKEFKQAFMNMVDEAVEPGAAVTMAEAETLPRKVRLTKGDVTRDVRQQAMESRAEKGAMGAEPYQKMDEFRRGQRDELVANRDLIQAGVGQTEDLAPSVAGRGEGMAQAQDAMHATRRSMYESMKAAYNEADRLGMRVDIEGLRIVRDHIDESLRTFPRQNNPVRDELLELNQVTQTGKGGPRLKAVTIKELEDLRSTLTTMSRSNDPTTAQAARVATRALDEGLEVAIEQGAYSGNVQALRMYQKGIRTRRLMAEMFEENQLVNGIMETRYGPTSTLKRPPDEAANMIFAGDALGFKTGAENALKQIRTNLLAAKNDQAWNAIREEAIWRLFISTESTDIMSDGARAFSGKKLATLLDKTFRNHKRLMDVLFTPQEQGLLRQFRNVAVNATSTVKGAENYSNTMIEGARIAEMIFGKGARLVQNMAKAFQTVRDYGEQSATTRIASEATDYGRGYRPPGRRFPPGSVGGMSAIGAGENERRQQTMSQRGRRRLER